MQSSQVYIHVENKRYRALKGRHLVYFIILAYIPDKELSLQVAEMLSMDFSITLLWSRFFILNWIHQYAFIYYSLYKFDIFLRQFTLMVKQVIQIVLL